MFSTAITPLREKQSHVKNYWIFHSPHRWDGVLFLPLCEKIRGSKVIFIK